MVIIEDGTGGGYAVKVCDENRFLVEAVVTTLEHHSNQDHKEAYHVLFEQTPTAVGDCFFYLKNLSDEDLIIEGLWLRVASNEQIQVKLGDTGTPSGGTTATPVNNNAGSTNEADGTFQKGNDITGLSGGSVVEKYWLAAGNESKHFNFEQDIILAKNNVLTLWAVAGAIEIDGTIVFHYHSC